MQLLYAMYLLREISGLYATPLQATPRSQGGRLSLPSLSASAAVAYSTLDNLGGYDASPASAINGSASRYGYQAWANQFVAGAAR